ncbi:MAG: EAL domain-containing protein [Acetobacteraceae bacterium]|nr:EAL domain-containing protein [Acetobacteraceae bacterium]
MPFTATARPALLAPRPLFSRRGLVRTIRRANPLLRVSVAARIASVGGLVVALAIAITAWSVVRQVERAMTERMQSRLEINLRVAEDQLRTWGGEGPVRLVEGRLVAPNGTVLDGDVNLVDRIRDITDGPATIFRGDLRVATNVLLPDGSRALGTHLAPGPVYDTVLRGGHTFRGDTAIYGISYLSAYQPLKDVAGNVVGILYVGVSKESYFSILQGIRSSALLWGAAMIAIGIAAIFIVVRRAFRPLDAVRDAMGALAAGRLDAAIPSVGRTDEVGRMARAVQVFQRTAIEVANIKAAELRDTHSIARVGTWRRDLVQNTLVVSEEMHAVLGLEMGDTAPETRKFISLVHPDDLAETEQALTRARNGESPVVHEARIIRENGQIRWIRFQTHTETDAAGTPVAVRGACQDTTEQHTAADRIHWLAHHDPLTGLPNRTLLHERMNGMVARTRSNGATLAVLCLDLDGFKTVNDLHGHAAGDTVLREVGSRLRRNTRESDTVARLGGDEFVVLHEASANPQGTRALAERLIADLAEAYLLDNGQLGHITVSVGIAMFPIDGNDPQALLRNADTALYRAKADGKNGYAFFRPDMDVERRERRYLENDLWQAIDRNEFHLVWQPLCLADDPGRVTGFEVLLRWQHPVRGAVSPAEFIPVAEDCGAISTIGAWVLRQACCEAAQWAVPLLVSVNVSPLQAQAGDAFAVVVEQILDESGLSASRLMLEVTEGVLIREPERVLIALRRLKALGVQVALDDFGTGYSSLATLRAFPFDKIKIDRAFITGVAVNGQDAAIVRAVLGLANGLGLPVIAEGVETSTQLEALCTLGCQEVQGWLPGRPAPIDSWGKITRASSPVAAELPTVPDR